MAQAINPFEIVKMKLGKHDRLNLDNSIYEILKEPEKVLIVAIPIKMDDGSTRLYRDIGLNKYRHRPGQRRCKVSPDISLDEVKHFQHG